MSHVKDAIAAAARCDTLTRRNRVDAHAAKLDELVTNNRKLLEAYNKGPTGNIQRDKDVLGQSLLAIVKGVYLAKREREARIEQIRNHDDILRGLVPKLYRSNHDDTLSAEVHEYVQRIQQERKRCTVAPDTPKDYLAIPCTPEINSHGGNYKWFHPGVIFYRDGMEHELVTDVLSLNFDWAEFALAHARDYVDGPVEEIPFDFDKELLAELEESSAHG